MNDLAWLPIRWKIPGIIHGCHQARLTLVSQNPAEQRALASGEHMRLRDGHPVALQSRRRRAVARVWLAADPPLGSLAVKGQVKDVPTLKLRPVRRHVVFDFAELADYPQTLHTGFLVRLSDSCRLRRLSRLDAPARNLQAGQVPRLVEVSEDEEPPAPDDVAEHFLANDHGRRIGLSAQPYPTAWKGSGVRADRGSAGSAGSRPCSERQAHHLAAGQRCTRVDGQLSSETGARAERDLGCAHRPSAP